MDSSRHSISPHPWLPKPVFVSINRESVEVDRWKKQTNIPSVNFKASKFFFGSNRSLPWGWNTVQKHQQMYFIPEGNMHSSSKFESLASEAGWVRFPTPLQQACAQGWSVIEHRTFWHFWTRVLVKRPPPVQGLTRSLNTAWCSRPCVSSSAGNAAFTCPESTEAALGLVLKASGVWEAFLLPPTLTDFFWPTTAVRKSTQEQPQSLYSAKRQVFHTPALQLRPAPWGAISHTSLRGREMWGQAGKHLIYLRGPESKKRVRIEKGDKTINWNFWTFALSFFFLLTN